MAISLKVARLQKMKRTYFEAVKRLHENDRNATFDEILEEYEYDLEYANEILKSVLDRIIEEDGYEKDELKFYIDIRKTLV